MRKLALIALVFTVSAGVSAHDSSFGADLTALQSREQVRDYVRQRTEADFQRLVQLAREGGELPQEFSFLITQAERIFRAIGRPEPEQWNAPAVLSAFWGAQELRDAVEDRHRTELFSRLSEQRRLVRLSLQADMDAVQERLGPLTAADREELMRQTLIVLNTRIEHLGIAAPLIRRESGYRIYLEIYGSAYSLLDIADITRDRGMPSFHLVDEEATASFNREYNANPETTINSHGALINPAALPNPDLVLRGVYGRDFYGLDIQMRNTFGNPNFVVIRKEAGLGGEHIRSVEVSRSSDPMERNPVVSFTLDYEGAQLFYRFTSANIGKPFAIVVEDRVRITVIIRGPIRDSVSLYGLDVQEARDLAMLLRSGSLPAALTVVSKQSTDAPAGGSIIR